MKPRIGVYLSEQMAARLAAAAKRPGASKSALVEAALAQFFGSDDDSDNLPVDRRLSLMSRQLEQLDRDLRVVNESVALQARYQLAATPPCRWLDRKLAPDSAGVPAVCCRLLSLISIPDYQCDGRRLFDIGIWPQRWRSWSTDVCLLPDLCGCPDSDRHLVGPIWSGA